MNSEQSLDEQLLQLLATSILQLFEAGQQERALDMLSRFELHAKKSCVPNEMITVLELRSTMAQKSGDWAEVRRVSQQGMSLLDPGQERYYYFVGDLVAASFEEGDKDCAVLTALKACMLAAEQGLSKSVAQGFLTAVSKDVLTLERHHDEVLKCCTLYCQRFCDPLTCSHLAGDTVGSIIGRVLAC